MSKDIIGFWGCPPPEIIKNTKQQYPSAEWVDLDIQNNAPDLKFIPDSYCVIIKNIYNNARALKERIIKIIAPVGKDKCDSAYFIAKILKEEGMYVEICTNEYLCPDIKALNLPISESILPLRKKVDLITKNIYEQKDYSALECSKPSFGFWGVPPNDLDILDLFPDGTRVFGWLRAVEAGYPGDWAIETFVDPKCPTVFFTQTFCSKTTVAKYLANKYQGLLIDVDGASTQSARAKIEAFIKLR